MAIITETLRPTSIVSIQNFTPNNVAYIQDDPSTPDANNIVPIDASIAPRLELRFDAPNGTFTGSQTINVYAVDPNWIGVHIEVFENGTNIHTSAVEYPGAGANKAFPFDASIITDKTGAGITVTVVGHVYNGMTIQSVNAVEWNATVEEGTTTPPPETPETFSTEFDEYVVGAFPSDWTEIWATGTDSTWQVVNESNSSDGVVLQHTATADGRRIITWNDVGEISGDFDILVKWKVSQAIDGDIPTRVMAYASGTTQATQNAYQLDSLFPSTLRIGKTQNGSYSTLASNVSLPFTIDNNLWYWYRFRKVGSTLYGKLWKDGTDEPTDFMVTITDTSLTSGKVGLGAYDYTGSRQFDSFSVGTDGAIIEPPNISFSLDGTSAANASLQAEISVQRGLNGQSDAFSSMNGSTIINRDLNGRTDSISETFAQIGLVKNLNGSIDSSSNIEATIKKEIELIATTINSFSNVEGVLSETNGLFGSIQANSGIDLTINIIRNIEGFINSVSSMQGNAGIERGINGSIQNDSFLTSEIEIEKQISGSIEIDSFLHADLNKQIILQGSIQANSSLQVNLDLEGQVSIRGSINSVSTFTASIDVSKPLEGIIESMVFTSGELTVEGEVHLSGNIESQSIVSSTLTKEIQLDASIFVPTNLTGSIDIEYTAYLNGQIEAISDVSSDLSIYRSLIGETIGNANVTGSIFVAGETILNGSIVSHSELQGLLGLAKVLTGEIVGKSTLYDQEPIDTLVEVDTVRYNGVSSEDDGKLLSYSIDSGIGRRIEFVFEFNVAPEKLQKLNFRVEGTRNQPFTLRAFNYVTGEWDVATTVTYDGRLEEQFVSLILTTINPYLDTNNILRIRMLSQNKYSSGTMTLSTDYAELIKTYSVR